LPADDPRQFWYDVSGFQDGVKLRATAGGAVESFVFLTLVFRVIHTTTTFLFTDARKMWNVSSSSRVEMPSQKDKSIFI
jgi:hypothetical protein